MKMKRAFVLICLLLTALALMAFTVSPLAKTQEGTPPAVPISPSTGQVVLDMALMVAITAFLKSAFGVTGKPVMAIAFGVGVVLWGAPLISSAYPAVGTYLDSFLAFLKIWLGAMGSVDLVTNVGAKIATARMAPSGKITTGTPSANEK